MGGAVDALRYALRRTTRRPGVAASAVLILALGIGLSTAVFTVVRRVLLRPIPVPDLHRLVVAWETDPSRTDALIEVSYPCFLDWRAESRSFEDLAAFGSVNWSHELRGAPRRETVPSAAVSFSFFDTLGARALLGRTFLPSDESPGAEDVLVLSHGLWQRRFGGDPRVVGTKVMGADRPFTIVGVMPQDFDFPQGAQVWTPLAGALAPVQRSMSPAAFRGLGVLYVVGRLRPGVSREAARSDLAAITSRLSLADGQRAEWSVRVRPLLDHYLGTGTRKALEALMVASAFVLLLACANVAVLLLVQAIASQDDLAVRRAIGASAVRLALVPFAEGLVLATGGGVAGTLLAKWAVQGLAALGPAELPGLAHLAVDRGAVAIAVLVSGVVAVLVALAPAWLAWRVAAAPIGSSSTGRVGPDRRAASVTRALVAAEVALSIVLLVGSGLMVRSLRKLLLVDLGFRPENTLSFHLGLDGARYPARAQVLAFRRALLERLRALPGVKGAGAIHVRPLEHGPIGSDNWVLFEGQSLELASVMKDSVSVTWQAATPGYFPAIGTGLLEGRDFTDRDSVDAPRVVIVSEGLAHRAWPGESAIGKRLHTADAKGELKDGHLVNVEWQTVVGVVENARYRGIQNPRHDIYVPEAQATSGTADYVVLRTTGDPLALARAAREAVGALDPDAEVGGVTTMTRLVERALLPWRLSSALLGAFALAALALTASGLFAVLHHFVSSKRREIAIRVAVGAAPRQVRALVAREGLRVTLAGLALGLTVAAALARSLAALLYGVGERDPSTYLAGTALVGFTAALACTLPALRAAKVDPAVALRGE
jgi:predicted permease